ncbi:hypothetical protein [Rhizobium sp. L1K21]|uniref:hypothetical protein n=1 Tax=Rhizobium sp. L1K21 TaxID=2954933 RepID=UPI002091EF00|nr:hypothetical protein [Rhizobium sp. L1K21]MCO6186473.1 hypothetical protein [Rhizobium sp. L1K21]
MPKLRNFLMIGAAVTAVAAVVTGPALARAIEYHEMNVQAPDGEIAHVRYAGNTPPKVSFDAGPVADDAASPFDVVPFAEVERISQALDRQAAALLTAAVVPPIFTIQSPGAVEAQLAKMPKGAEGYSFVSVTSGGKTCTERMSYGYDGHGKPVVQKASAGDCGAQGQTATTDGAAKSPLKVSAKPSLTQTLKQDWKKIETSI